MMRSLIGFLLAAALVTACSDEPTTPTGPSAMPGPPTLVGAQVLAGGMPIEGLVTQGTDEPVVFRARVHAPGGLQTLRRVVLQYSQPGPNHHGGPMMGRFNGQAFLYDDGTHCDDVAGDGIYCFMDPDDRIGCHGLSAPPGNYDYAFWCEDHFGQISNTISITIRRQ